MYVLILSIRLHAPATAPALLARLDAASEGLPMIHSHLLQLAILARPLDPQVIWRICFECEDDYQAMLLDPVWTAQVVPLLGGAGGVEVEQIFYRRSLFAAPFPNICQGIWRTLIVAVKAGVAVAQRRQFEAEMQMMPSYIGTIRNWALNPVLSSKGSRSWSYVWEQDFDDVNGLLNEYRMHPIHFGLVDRWYDPEHPDHILDARRLRLVCNAPESAIAPPRRSVQAQN